MNPDDDEQKPLLMTVREATIILDCGRALISKMFAEKKLTKVRLSSRSIRLRRVEVEALALGEPPPTPRGLGRPRTNT